MNTFKFDYYQYKKRISQNKSIPFSVLMIFIIVLSGIFFFFKPKEKQVFFYFVEVDCFISYTEAIECANEISSKNAGGYIYFHNTYHVLACVYPNKEDANKAKNNIESEYKNARILTLSSLEFNGKNLPKHQEDAINEVISANKTTLSKLYGLIKQLDNEFKHENAIEIEIKKLVEEYNKQTNNFKNIFRTNKDATRQKEIVVNISSSINDCLNCTNLSKSLKYNAIKIAILSYSFLECFC